LRSYFSKTFVESTIINELNITTRTVCFVRWSHYCQFFEHDSKRAVLRGVSASHPFPGHEAVMASHVVVIDTSLRRVQIKITQSKYVSDILEEACKKLGLEAGNYNLK
jgi:TUG ubiquitin-like domain